MSQPADVDEMVSGFLSELNTLCDSLGLSPDKAVAQNDLSAVDSPGLNGPRNPAGSALALESVPEEYGTRHAKDGEAIPPAASKTTPYRNIDVLLMSDNRFIAGRGRSPEEFSRTSNTSQDYRIPGISNQGQPGIAGWAPFRLRLSCWVPFSTWIRKFRGQGSGRSGIHRLEERPQKSPGPRAGL